MPATWAAPRLKARSVGRPPGDVQKPARQPGKGLEVRPCPGAGAERPMSAMNTGTTGRVRAMTQGRGEVHDGAPAQHGHRATTARTTWGR